MLNKFGFPAEIKEILYHKGMLLKCKVSQQSAYCVHYYKLSCHIFLLVIMIVLLFSSRVFMRFNLLLNYDVQYVSLEVNEEGSYCLRLLKHIAPFFKQDLV